MPLVFLHTHFMLFRNILTAKHQIIINRHVAEPSKQFYNELECIELQEAKVKTDKQE